MNEKLCDFGLATEMTTDDVLNGGIFDARKERNKVTNTPFENKESFTNQVVGEVACGMPLYMALERIMYCHYDDRSDIWRFH